MASHPKALDLKSVWLFSSCTNNELKKIRGLLEEVHVPAKKMLVEQGTIGREFFLIVDGEANVIRSGKTIARLGPGAYFGELALLAERERTATVTAETAMDCLEIPSWDFQDFVKSDPEVSWKLLRHVVDALLVERSS